MPKPNGKVMSAFLGGLVALAGALLLLIPQFPSRGEVREMVGDMVPNAVEQECEPGWEAVQKDLLKIREALTELQIKLLIWEARWDIKQGAPGKEEAE